MDVMPTDPPDAAPPTPAEPYLQYADQLVRTIRETLPKAMDGDDAKAVHHCRVATRRMAAFLEATKTLLAKPGRKRMDRALRKVRRRLGALDADVSLGHLADGAFKSDGPAVEWVGRQVNRDRGVAMDDLGKGLSLEKTIVELDHWPALRNEIALSCDSLPRSLIQSLHTRLATFSESADALAKTADGEAAVPQGVPTAGRVEPHAVRIAGKALRYTLELAGAGLAEPPEELLRDFKKLQDALGLWHDFIVLAERALRRSLDHQLILHDAALQCDVLDFAGRCLDEVRDRLREFARLWRKSRGGHAKGDRSGVST